MTNTLPLLILALVAAAPAAAEPLPPQTVTVATADLDLGTAAGQRALDARLNRAVVEVCGVASDADLAGLNSVRACRTAKLAEARTQRDQLAQGKRASGIELAMR